MRYRPTSMLALVQKYKGVNRTRERVVDRVTELEGLKDDLLIDMIMRRIEDAPDKEHFQESVSVLMGVRANSFTNDLCAFLLNGKDPITNDPSSATAPTHPAQGLRAAANPVFASAFNTGPGTSAVPCTMMLRSSSSNYRSYGSSSSSCRSNYCRSSCVHKSTRRARRARRRGGRGGGGR